MKFWDTSEFTKKLKSNLICFHKKGRYLYFKARLKIQLIFLKNPFWRLSKIFQNPLEHHHWSKQNNFTCDGSQFRLFLVASYSISLGIIQRLKNYFFWKCSRNVPRWVFSLELIENFDYLIICCNDFNSATYYSWI